MEEPVAGRFVLMYRSVEVGNAESNSDAEKTEEIEVREEHISI